MVIATLCSKSQIKLDLVQVQKSGKGGMCPSGFHPTSLHPKTGHKVRFKFNENKI